MARPERSDAERRTEAPEPTPGRTSVPRRIASVALWTVVVTCALAYLASIAVPLWFQVNGQRLLIVTSGSMAPAFDAGDAVVLRTVQDPSDLKVNQVVSFWPVGSEHLVTHRIHALHMLPRMEQQPDGTMTEILDEETGEPQMAAYLITKGDANLLPDIDAVPISRVRGVVLTSYTGWGWVLQWTTSPQGRAIMLVPPLVALGLLELLAVTDGRRRRRAGPVPTERTADDLLLD